MKVKERLNTNKQAINPPQNHTRTRKAKDRSKAIKAHQQNNPYA